MVQFYNSLFDSFFFPSFSIPSWSIPWLEIPADFRFDFVSRDGGPGIILPAIEKAPVKSRSSSRRGSMTRAIHRGSWIAGKRERHSWKEEWWTKKRNGIDRGLSMSPFYRRSYIIVALSPFQDLLNSAVSLPRGNIDTHACDLYGEIESAIIESPHGGMDP